MELYNSYEEDPEEKGFEKGSLLISERRLSGSHVQFEKLTGHCKYCHLYIVKTPDKDTPYL